MDFIMEKTPLPCETLLQNPLAVENLIRDCKQLGQLFYTLAAHLQT